MNKSSFEVLLLENVFNNWTLSEIHQIAFSMKTTISEDIIFILL